MSKTNGGTTRIWTPMGLSVQQWEQELEFARRVQTVLLESRCVDLAGLQACGRCVPRHAVGGDYFDFLPLPDGGLRIVIADVMGKGFGAAMLMTMFRAAVRTATPHCPAPGALLKHINDLFYDDLQAVGAFITAACVDCRPAVRTLSFASGGHPYPLMLRQDSPAPQVVKVRGVSLGMMPDQVYTEQSVTLEPGDLVVMHTDGLMEAKLRTGKGLTAEGLQELVRLHGDRPLPDMLREILIGVDAHAGGNQAADDVTIVALRFAMSQNESGGDAICQQPGPCR
ncbi:MAG TPA: PP2C family protein-serine/threonine phosphatase [Symbiobacteriaceae bacterium]|jgi:serine phosphatase RsbU (regulator of sigma subunit)